MKRTLTVAGVIGLLLAALYYQHDRLTGVRGENRILNANIEVLTGEADRYRVRDSLSAVSARELSLKLADYERYRAEDARLLADLRIQLKRAESVSKSASELSYEITTTVHDTVTVYEGHTDTVRAFSYHTPYVDMSGTLKADTASISLVTRDTILQVVHRVPRRFLFIRYGTKAIRQEVVSTNPHARITYTEYVRFRK